ncbi:hypothetical protein ABIA45_007450 [Bradyrhizobium sp. USDA 336]
MDIEAPTTPSASRSQLRRPIARWPSAIRKSVPLSSLLSARSRSSTYLAMTTLNNAHRISESTPSTINCVTGHGPDSLVKRVEWRGADVAEHDTDTPEREGPKARGDRPFLGLGLCDPRRHEDGKRFVPGINPAPFEASGLAPARSSSSAAHVDEIAPLHADQRGEERNIDRSQDETNSHGIPVQHV